MIRGKFIGLVGMHCVNLMNKGVQVFRVFRHFIKALLAKQGWRIIHNPFSLVSQILRRKYFHSSSSMDARFKSNSSCLWQSLMWAREIIHIGVRWKVGNGYNIHPLSDSSVPRPSSFKPVTSLKSLDEIWKVGDFILDGGQWDTELLREYFFGVGCGADQFYPAQSFPKIRPTEMALRPRYEIFG